MKSNIGCAVIVALVTISNATAIELDHALRGEWFGNIEGYPSLISISLLGRAKVDNRECVWKTDDVSSIEIQCDGMRTIVVSQRTEVMAVSGDRIDIDGEVVVEFDQYPVDDGHEDCRIAQSVQLLASLREARLRDLGRDVPTPTPILCEDRRQTSFSYYSAKLLRQQESEQREQTERKTRKAWGSE